MLRVWLSLIALIYYSTSNDYKEFFKRLYYNQSQQIQSSMDNPKIPDLNLFRGKRNENFKTFDLIQKRGIDAISRGTKGKDYLHQIQAENYLENFQSNLKHFISPTKYKNEAEKYLKSHRDIDQVILKRIQFPQTRRHCINCYANFHQKQQKCHCENNWIDMQSRKAQQRLSLNRQKMSERRDVLNEAEPMKPNIKIIETIIEQPRIPRKKNEQLASQDFFLSQSEKSVNRQSKQSQIQESFSQQRHKRHKLNIDFQQNVRKKQSQLRQFQVPNGQSSILNIDFNGLNQAKKQYIDKSQQILDKLNYIIQKHAQQ